MASNRPNGAPHTPDLEAATVTPIAELGPHLSDTATRSTRGVITIVWPYSILTKSLSFVLAEPDFRLRRQKGQVRVTFVGPGAKVVSDASLGGGDEVLLSLSGVEWAEGDAPGAPGTTLEWQARFPAGALLRADGSQFKEPKIIRVDPTAQSAPDAEPSLPNPPEQPIESPPIKSPSIRPATPDPILPAKRRIQEDLGADEYASPAFVKRARVSYGSLFEGGFNIFDEDVEPARGRKRTKFGRDSSAWRYNSQSRSPEPEDAQEKKEPSGPAEGPSGEAPKEPPSQESRESSRAPMTDEACQTSDAAPSPTTPSKRHEERSEAREPSPAPPAVAHAQEGISSPMHHQDVTVGHDEGDGLGAVPQETIPEGLNQVHIAEDQHVRMEHGTLTAFQEQTMHRPGERGVGSPFGGFAGEPMSWGSSVPYPSFHPSQEFPIDSFIPHEHAPVHPGLSQTFAPSFQHHHVPEPLPPPFGGHETMERAAEPQARQPEPYAVSSDVESIKRDTTDGRPSADAVGEHRPVPPEESFKALIPDQRTKDEWADAVKDSGELPGPEMTSRVDEDMDVEEAESFPSDDGDEGGDYDTRNYRDLQDDDNASDVDEDYEDYGEMDTEIYDPDEENYDQEDEYGEESEVEDEQGEYGWEGAAEDAAPPAPAAPVFIDLISDSEDEGQGQGEVVRQEDKGQAEQENVDTHGEVEAAREQERAGDIHEDGHGEEESYSEDESEDGARSQEGSEEEWEEEEDKHSVPQSPERIPLSRQYDGADNIPSHTFAAVDQGENEGAEAVDMVSKPSPLAVLSSPPPEQRTPPVAAEAAERPAPTESPSTGPAAETDQHEPGTGPGPSEPAGVSTTDEVQEHVAQVAEAREQTPSPDTRETSAQEITMGANVQMADAAAEPSAQPAVSPSDRGAREPTPSPDTEAVEQATQGIVADTDVQMTTPAAEPPMLQTAASLPSGKAPEPTREIAEGDQVEVVPAEPARESLDDEVQADIERQLEDSLIIESKVPEAPTTRTDEQAHESDGQPHGEAKSEKGASRTPGAQALASPPLTQAPQSQPDAEDTNHEEVTTGGGPPEADHLPTPSATQLASASQSFNEAFTTVEQGHPTEESKVTLESPTLEPQVTQAKATPARAPQESATPTTETSQTERAAPPISAEGFAITVKSLRSRRQRSASTEKREPSRRDPSTRLARDSLAARERSSKRDPSAQLAKASLAARRGAPDTTPPTGRTTRSKTRSIRMSATPEPEPRSPELGEGEPEKESQGILKLQLNKSLRLTLLDLTALKVLRTNINRKVDVLGVATAQPPTPQRPKHGPRDYLLHLTLADQTTAPNGVVAVQVFRPHIESLPLVREGDAVLLRRFTVTALRGQGFGLRSCDESSWAVWERDGGGAPQVKGPPPEVSGDEGAQAGLLLRWYAGLDGRAREKLGRASAKMGQ